MGGGGDVAAGEPLQWAAAATSVGFRPVGRGCDVAPAPAAASPRAPATAPPAAPASSSPPAPVVAREEK